MTAPFILAALLCTGPISRVVDADTVVVACDQGRPVTLRLADVDAAESPPRAKCQVEANRAALGTSLVRRSLTGARVTVTPDGTRSYDRTVGDATILDGPWMGWSLTAAIARLGADYGLTILQPWPHDATGATAPKPEWCE